MRALRSLLPVLCLLASSPAWANGAPQPEPVDLEVVVEGSGVRIAESLPHTVVCEVLRYSSETVPPSDMTTVGEYGWLHEEPVETWLECWPLDDMHWKLDCGETPELCDDCDGDDVNECAGYCERFGRFEFVDECVPVIEGEEEHRYEWCGCSDCVEATVLPVDPCQDVPAEEEFLGEDPGDCQCRLGARPGPAAVGTALVMLALGGGCLAVARRWR